MPRGDRMSALVAAILLVAQRAERYAERIDRADRSYESTQLLISARQLVRSVELFSEWKGCKRHD